MTATITPGGCSASSGARGSTGACEQLAYLIGGFPLTGSVAEVDRGRRHAFEGEVSGLGDVPAGVPKLGGGALGDPCGLRDVVDPHIGLPAGAGGSDVGDGVEVVLTVATGDSSALESSPEPMAWNPTSRKTTPRNSSTITMARRGSPEESEWRSFIGPTVSARRADPRKPQVTSKPRRRAARAFCLLARSRRSRLTSIGSAASASGRSTSALSTW